MELPWLESEWLQTRTAQERRPGAMLWLDSLRPGHGRRRRLWLAASCKSLGAAPPEMPRPA